MPREVDSFAMESFPARPGWERVGTMRRNHLEAFEAILEENYGVFVNREKAGQQPSPPHPSQQQPSPQQAPPQQLSPWQPSPQHPMQQLLSLQQQPSTPQKPPQQLSSPARQTVPQESSPRQPSPQESSPRQPPQESLPRQPSLRQPSPEEVSHSSTASTTDEIIEASGVSTTVPTVDELGNTASTTEEVIESVVFTTVSTVGELSNTAPTTEEAARASGVSTTVSTESCNVGKLSSSSASIERSNATPTRSSIRLGKRLRSVSLDKIDVNVKARVMEAIFAVKSSPVPVVVSDIKSFTKAKEDSTRNSKADTVSMEEKIQKKKKEEAKRKEEAEEKKRQQLLVKKQQREERARKVAEKQAALEKQRVEKKMKIMGGTERRAEEQKQKRAKALEERNRRKKEVMAAAEARRKAVMKKQEEKKLAEMKETDERMAAAEARRKQEAEAQRKKLEEKNRQEAETLKKRLEEKKMAEKLAESKKEAESKKRLEAAHSKPIAKLATPNDHFNQTYTVTPPHADPTEKNVGENETSSYDITMNGDPLMDCENYDIGDLSSEDSTDDEDCPKKPVPQWVLPERLDPHFKEQEEAVTDKRLSVTDIFPPQELLMDCNLNRIFRFKRKRFYQRTSSAMWTSPMIKNKKHLSN